MLPAVDVVNDQTERKSKNPTRAFLVCSLPTPCCPLLASSWMIAADYFMSARARGLRVAPELDALGTATIRHLVWRFNRIYGDEEMMRTMVG